MPIPVECDGCELRLLGLASCDPAPIDFDRCPDCGGSDFSHVDG